MDFQRSGQVGRNTWLSKQEKLGWMQFCTSWTRESTDANKIAGFMKELTDSILDDKDMNDACANLEKKGIFMRLD